MSHQTFAKSLLALSMIFSGCKIRSSVKNGSNSSLQSTIADVKSFVADYQKPRKITAVRRTGQIVDIDTTGLPIRVEVLRDDVFKVRIAKRSTHGEEYTWSVDEHFKSQVVSFSIDQSSSTSISIKTKSSTLIVDRQTSGMTLLNSKGEIVLELQRHFADEFEDSVNRLSDKPAQRRLLLGSEFKMHKDDHFYGLGQKLRGQHDQSLDWRRRRRDWTPSGATMGNQFDGADGAASGNILIPFLLSTRGAGIFLDTAYRTYWEFDDAAQKSWYVKLDCDQDWQAGLPKCDRAEMRFYFMAGSSPAEILDRYTEVTGKPILPPRWLLGYLQSNYGYKNWGEVHATVSSLQRNGFPVDGLFLDLQWFGGVPGVHGDNGEVLPQFSDCRHRRIGSLNWSESAPFDFSNAPRNLSQLASLGVHVAPIEEGYFDSCLNTSTANGQNFSDAEASGFLAKRDFGSNTAALYANGDDKDDSRFGSVGYFGQVGMIDTSSPEARKWFWSKHLPILKSGASLFWTDLGEPERYRWWWKYNKDFWHQDIHNVWDLNRARGFYEGYTKDLPGERPFVVSRSGYAGSQRFGVGVWSGDAPAHLGWAAAQTSAHLNLAVSGIAYTTSDIGGFGGFPVSNGAQFSRWLQMEAFSSLMRAHGNTTTGANTARIVHPDGFGEPYTSINRKYVNWRESLVPYIYTLAREAFDTGLPIARALPLHWPNDTQAHDIGSEFMLGPWMLVAPVLYGEDNNPREARDIYLPEGTWYDMHDGTKYDGQSWLRNFAAPLAKLPVFARAGAIIPKTPKVTSLADSTWNDTRILEIYPGSGSSHFVLYDDDGKSNDYRNEKKAFATTRIETRKLPKQIDVTIGPMIGKYSGMPAKRSYALEVLCDQDPTRVSWSGGTMAVDVIASANRVTPTLNKAVYNKTLRSLVVQFPNADIATAQKLAVLIEK